MSETITHESYAAIEGLLAKKGLTGLFTETQLRDALFSEIEKQAAVVKRLQNAAGDGPTNFDTLLKAMKPEPDWSSANIRLGFLQYEIHEWAKTNFGNNQSKTDPHVCLDSIGSLLGVMEELGEYTATGESSNAEEMADALADMLIYLCDYASRTDTEIKVTQESYAAHGAKIVLDKIGLAVLESPIVRLATIIGRLCHINLKRHQGIRGYNVGTKFHDENAALVSELFLAISSTCTLMILPITEYTWGKVKQRNWKKNPTNAHVAADPSTAEAYAKLTADDLGTPAGV